MHFMCYLSKWLCTPPCLFLWLNFEILKVFSMLSLVYNIGNHETTL